MQPAQKTLTAYQQTKTYLGSAQQKPQGRNKPLLALAKWTCLVLFMAAVMCGVNVRLHAVYGVHIAQWHKVTVTQGDTVYNLATASHAGDVMGVVMAIEQRNGMQNADVQAGAVLWVPVGRVK